MNSQERKKSVVNFLLQEYGMASSEEMGTSSAFWGRMLQPFADVGAAFKKGIKDVLSATWGTLGTIFAANNKKARERHRAALQRSRQYAAEYSSAKSRIDAVLKSPGGMLFLGGLLPAGVAPTGYLLSYLYGPTSEIAGDVGQSVDERLDELIAQLKGVRPSKAAAAAGTVITPVEDLKRIFYGNIGESLSTKRNLISEKSDAPSDKESKKDSKEKIIAGIKETFNSLRKVVNEAIGFIDVIVQRMESYEQVVKAKNKQKDDEGFEEFEKIHQSFIRDSTKQLQEELMDQLKSIPFLEGEISSLQVKPDTQTLLKIKETLQKISGKLSID